MSLDLIAQIATRFFQRQGFPVRQSWLPLRPLHSAMRILQRPKQRVVIQPERISITELFKVSRQMFRRAALEILKCSAQQAIFEVLNSLKLNLLGGKIWRVELFESQQAVGDQLTRIDQEWIAREGRQQLVW